MKEVKIIVKDNYISKSDAEKKEIIKKNIARLLVREIGCALR